MFRVSRVRVWVRVSVSFRLDVLGLCDILKCVCVCMSCAAYVTCVPGASMDVGSDQTCVSEATAIKETSLSATYCR